jgi:hypothetical protein
MVVTHATCFAWKTGDPGATSRDVAVRGPKICKMFRFFRHQSMTGAAQCLSDAVPEAWRHRRRRYSDGFHRSVTDCRSQGEICGNSMGCFQRF